MKWPNSSPCPALPLPLHLPPPLPLPLSPTPLCFHRLHALAPLVYRYVGRTFPSFQRIGLCARQGVAIVLEQGDDPTDDVTALAVRLGGVHLVPYAHIAPKVAALIRDPSTWRLTREEVARWQAFKDALYAWNGTVGGLRAMFSMFPDHGDAHRGAGTARGRIPDAVNASSLAVPDRPAMVWTH